MPSKRINFKCARHSVGYTQTRHAISHGPERNSQDTGGRCAIAASPLQSITDDSTLNLVEMILQRASRQIAGNVIVGRRNQAQVICVNHRIVGQRQCALQNILQLANIARKRIIAQGINGIISEFNLHTEFASL